jgi:hypothetical protein
MAGGGIAIGVGVTAAELLGIVIVKKIAAAKTQTARTAVSQGGNGQWRPPQWSKAALYMITVPGAYVADAAVNTTNTPVGSSPQSDADGNMSITMNVLLKPATPPPPQYLVFDGVMRASHTQQARPTQYPVQNQANFTDHVILEPARLSLDIIMSDAIQSYADGQWVGNPSKSISCFLVLDSLRAARVPLTVTTRLKTYYNMTLVDVVPEETPRTRHGLRARLEFQEVYIATVSTSATNGVSARQQTTDENQLGPTNTTPVPAGVQNQNGLPSTSTGVPSTPALESQNGAVNGAGNWSSNNTGQLVAV